MDRVLACDASGPGSIPADAIESFISSGNKEPVMIVDLFS